MAVAAGLQAADQSPPPTESVVVAGQDLAAGTVLAEADLQSVAYPEGMAPGGLVAEPVGAVLASAVRRGEPLTDVRLIGPELTSGRPELVALPVRLPDAGAVDLLAVGDVIDLVAADPQQGGAQVVARGVEVLALPAPDEAEFAGGTAGLSGRLVILGAPSVEISTIVAATVESYVAFTWAQR